MTTAVAEAKAKTSLQWWRLSNGGDGGDGESGESDSDGESGESGESESDGGKS
jgi:hypothetical protein